MVINIAICDDDKLICSQIENTLLSYTNSICLEVELNVFYDGKSLLDYIEQGFPLDVLYLDIEMDQIDGIEVGKWLRKVLGNHNIEIIYISGHDHYDRQLFDVQPLHFISKPIKDSIVIDDLKLALERARKQAGFFTYQKGFDIYKVPIKDIIYFESINRKIKIVTGDGINLFYGRLEDVLFTVSKYQFLQIHRSYLVNYNHVNIIRYNEVIMSNGEALPISKLRRQNFRNLQINED